MRVRASILALTLLAGCAHSPRDLVERGDRLLASGEAASAEAAYAQALRDSGLSGLLLARAQVGEARSLLARGDLRTAESRLNQVSDQVAAKWYVLGEVALRRGDPPEAESCFVRALNRGHGGDTARQLARLIAGEATAPEQLLRAQEILSQGGANQASAALAEAEAVWRELLAGADPGALSARLEPAAQQLPDLASVQLLRARLLELSGSPDAAAAWSLGAVQPAPSPAFRAHADRLRGRIAARARDDAALAALIATADPQVAGALAANLADARARRGDLIGAIRLLEAAGAREGPAGQLALARAAELEAWVGDPRSTAAWARLPEQPSAPPELVARVAWHQARERGLEPALTAAREAPQAEGELLPTAGRLASQAADALVRGDDAAALTDAAGLLVPGDALVAALADAARASDAAARVERLLTDAQGSDLRRRTAQRILLAEGQLDRARQLGAPDAGWDTDTIREAIRRALAAGRHAEVSAFLGAAALRPEQRAALDADVSLTGADVPHPAGRLAGLPPGTHQGTVLLPTRRLPGVTVEVTPTRWVLRGPGGTLVADDAEGLAEALGAHPQDTRWVAGPALALGAPPFRAASVWEVD